MTSDLQTLARALPYPLAGVALQALIHAERWDDGDDVPSLPLDVCRLSGLLLRMNAALAVSALVASGKTIPELNADVSAALQAPSDGVWLALARRIAGTLPSSQPPLQLLADSMARRPPVGGPDAPERESVGARFDKLVAYRNKIIHGTRVDAVAHREAIAHMRALVAAHAFYRGYALVANPEGHWFDCSAPRADSVRGQLPPWWTAVVRDALAALQPGTVVLIRPDAPSDRLVVSPFLRCVAAGKSGARYDDLFFLNRAAEGAAEYVAYGFEGHVDADELGAHADLRQLFARLRCPPMPRDKRISFAGLADFHEHRFIGRDEVLDEIAGRVRAAESKYVELRARSGLGKTAIMAHLYRRHAVEVPASARDVNPTPASSTEHRDRWVFHFCMPVDGRDDPLVALQNLVAQICDGAGLPRSRYLSGEVEHQRELFAQCLSDAGAGLREGQRLIVCIDALDEGIPAYGRHSVPSLLPGSGAGEPALPPAVVFLISYRIDAHGHSRVDGRLDHVPVPWRARLVSAAPLPGLDRTMVGGLLERLAAEAGSAEPTDEVLEAVWAAAATDADAGADPFYLRFLGDRVLEGTVDLRDPATVPSGLERMFEALWMGLPTGHRHATHRVLATLAVLREQGTDELMQQVIGAADPDTAVTLDDVRALRSPAHKLLVYDGERYGLFHDRFREFLIGPAGRFGPTHVARLHEALGDLASRWNDPTLSIEVRTFALHHGPHHLAMAGGGAAAAALLVHYPLCDARLRPNRSEQWVRDLEDVWDRSRQDLSPQTRDLLQSWVTFARERAHLLARGTESWPANQIMLQLAVEHADASPVTQAAERWLATGRCDWTWLRSARRPERVERSPCLRVLEGHAGPVRGVVRLNDDRILSWADDGVLNVWNLPRVALERRIVAHPAPVAGVVVLPSARAVSWSRNDKLVQLWDLQTGENLAALHGHTDGVHGCVATADGLLVSFASDVLWTWSAADGTPRHVLRGHDAAVAGVLALPDRGALSWSADGTLRAWDTVTGRARRIYAGHTAPVEGAMLIDARSLVSWSSEDSRDRAANMLRRWDLESGRQVSECVTCCFSPPVVQGGDLLTAPDERWNEAGANVNRAFRDALVDCDITTGIWALSGGRFVVRSAGGPWSIWDGVVPSSPRSLPGAFDRIEELHGGLLARRDEVLSILDPETGATTHHLRGHTAAIRGMLAMPDRQILTWSDDRTLRLWDLDAAEVAGHDLEEQDVYETITALSPSLLACASERRVDIATRATGDLVLEFFDHRSPSPRPGGELMCIHDEALYSTSPLTGRAVRLPINHRGQEGAVERRWPGSFTWQATGGMLGFRVLDDGLIVTWSNGGNEIAFWDQTTGMPLARDRRQAPIGNLLTEGDRLVAWGSDNFVNVWRWNPDALRDTARRLSANEAARAYLARLATGSYGMVAHEALKSLHRLRAEMGLPEGLAAIGKLGAAAPDASRPRLTGTARLTYKDSEPFEGSGRGSFWDFETVPGAGGARMRGARFLAGRLVAWSSDGNIRVWSETAESPHAFAPHDGGVRGVVDLGLGRLLSWGDDASIVLADVRTGVVKQRYGFASVLESPSSCHELPDHHLLFRWSKGSAGCVDHEQYWLVKYDPSANTLRPITREHSFAALLPWLRATEAGGLSPLFARRADVLAVHSHGGVEAHAAKFTASWMSTGAVGVHDVGPDGSIAVVTPRGLQVLQTYHGNARVRSDDGQPPTGASEVDRLLSARKHLLQWVESRISRPHLNALIATDRSTATRELVARRVVAHLLARLFSADADDAAASAFLEQAASHRNAPPELLASRGVDLEELLLETFDRQPDLEQVGDALAQAPAPERAAALRCVLAVRKRVLTPAELRKEEPQVLPLARKLEISDLERSLLGREAEERWASWSTAERIANLERRLTITSRDAKHQKNRLRLTVDLARLHLLDEHPEPARALLAEARSAIAEVDDAELKNDFATVWEQVGPLTSRLASLFHRIFW